MRRLLSLALLLPLLAIAEPAEAAPSRGEWAAQEGKRTTVEFVDGSSITGVIVDVGEAQARVRADDGSITFIPMGVVASLTNAPGEAAAAPRQPSGPPPADPPPPTQERSGPRVGLGVGVGVGMGPVSVGVGGVTGSRPVQGAAGPTGGFGNQREWQLVGVRYPLRGRETIDWMLVDDRGGARDLPDDLMRPRALREYTFVDQWGRSVPWQSAWAAMGAERDYILQVKKMDNVLIPLRATETVLWVSGLGLIVGTFIDEMSARKLAPNHATYYAVGTGLVAANIVFNLAVTNPTRNRLRVELGRKGLQRAQEHLALQP